MSKTNKPYHGKEKKASELLATIVRAENEDRAKRRRRLYNGVSRALLHLNDYEISAIEQIIWLAIGRSQMEKATPRMDADE